MSKRINIVLGTILMIASGSALMGCEGQSASVDRFLMLGDHFGGSSEGAVSVTSKPAAEANPQARGFVAEPSGARSA